MKDEIQALLMRISTLLLANNENVWGLLFLDFSERLKENYEYTLHEIKNQFGGAGSFSDLILMDKGKMLSDENNQLNKMQDELYRLLKKEIAYLSSIDR